MHHDESTIHNAQSIQCNAVSNSRVLGEFVLFKVIRFPLTFDFWNEKKKEKRAKKLLIYVMGR